VTSWDVRRRDTLAVIGFSHPPLDTVSHGDVADLELLLEELAAEGIRVVVLHGDPDVFVRHADLADLRAMAAGQPTSGDPSAWVRVLRLLDRGPMLSIAAVEGQAWGGGLEIALTCNLRILAEGASLCFPEVALGIIPGVAAHRLVRLVPAHTAIRLMAACETIDAARARQLGLTDTVVPRGAALEAALILAERISGFPADAVRAVRSLVLDHRDDDEGVLRRRQSELWAQCAATAESKSLVAAAQQAYDRGATSAAALRV
jgi:enoyl-CoA hydratase